MKVLVVGLGSMGKRRVRNLQELKVDEIIGFDVRSDRRKEAVKLYSIKVVDNFNSVIKSRPDAIIISTPPHKHLHYAMIAAQNGIHFFTEVNTMEPAKLQKLIDILQRKKVAGVPSTNLMFHPSVIRMKNMLKKGTIGKPLLFNFHSGSYLPDWHPWERLQDYYVYRTATGGGRDQIAWELSWIMALMGRPKSVMAITKKLGSFKARIYDTYDLLLEFGNNVVGHVMVDVIQRPPGRICEIIGEEGMIRWDYDRKLVRVFSKRNKRWIEYPERLDYKGYRVEKPRSGFAIKDTGMTESYVEEIKNFIEITKGKRKPEFTFNDEKILLKTMYAAEESSKTGKRIYIK